jgi:IS1 family transposase
MNRLPTAKRVQIVEALIEGSSLRAASRMADVSINTVTKLLVELGTACANLHDERVRTLSCKRIQCDEIWAYCYAKKRNVTPEIAARHPDAGDLWTWTAIDADTKLIVSYMIGSRTPPLAYHLIGDLRDRVTGIPQITTDGLPWYRQAIEKYFGIDVDYAVLEKHYGETKDSTVRYSPPRLTGISTEVIRGDPDPAHISTSYVERANLTMRMGMRRFTRLTNGFSKKAENHIHAVALHFAHYNFVRIHKSLRVTPAMAAGLTDHPWTVGELIATLGAQSATGVQSAP